MAFDDFVIERNLVSCLQINEANKENSGRKQYSCLQTGEEKTAENNVPLLGKCSQVLKTAVTLLYFLITAIRAESRCRIVTLAFSIL